MQRPWGGRRRGLGAEMRLMLPEQENKAGKQGSGEAGEVGWGLPGHRGNASLCRTMRSHYRCLAGGRHRRTHVS